MMFLRGHNAWIVPPFLNPHDRSPHMIPSTPRLTTSESLAQCLARDAQDRAGHGKPAILRSHTETRTEGRQHPEHIAVFEMADGTVQEFNGRAWTTRALLL